MTKLNRIVFILQY